MSDFKSLRNRDLPFVMSRISVNTLMEKCLENLNEVIMALPGGYFH